MAADQRGGGFKRRDPFFGYASEEEASLHQVIMHDPAAFERTLLAALIYDPKISAAADPLVLLDHHGQPIEDFVAPMHRALYQAVQNYHRTTNRAFFSQPSLDGLRLELSKVAEEGFDLAPEQVPQALQTFVESCRHYQSAPQYFSDTSRKGLALWLQERRLAEYHKRKRELGWTSVQFSLEWAAEQIHLKNMAGTAEEGLWYSIDDCLTWEPTEVFLTLPWQRLNRNIGGGLARGDATLLAGGTGAGKAQPLSEPVLTPDGWVEMGRLKEGDQVFGPDGYPTTVVGVYPQGVRPVYRLEFSDGTFARADEDHLWEVHTRKDKHLGRPSKVKTTKEIFETQCFGNGTSRWYLPVVEEIQFVKEWECPVDPWMLGVLFGDGCFRQCQFSVSLQKDGVREEFMRRGRLLGWSFKGDGRGNYRLRNANALKEWLKENALWDKYSHEKRIPEYLTISKGRKEFLKGLFDADGNTQKDSAELCTSSRDLAEQVADIIRSLGGVTSVRVRKSPSYTYKGERRTGRDSYRVLWNLEESPFAFRTENNHYDSRKKRASFVKAIRRVVPDGEEECQCIRVDHPRHLYVTRGTTLTHNTVVATQIAGHFSIFCGAKGVVISTEQKGPGILPRIVSCFSGVPFNVLNKHRAIQLDELAPENRRKSEDILLRLRNNHFFFRDWKPGDGVVTGIKSIVDHYVTKLSPDGTIDFIIMDWIGGNLDHGAKDKEEVRARMQHAGDSLALLADELGIVTVATAQANPQQAAKAAQVGAAHLAECKTLHRNFENLIGISGLQDVTVDAESDAIDTRYLDEQYLYIDKSRFGPGGMVPVKRLFHVQRLEERYGKG